MRLVKVRFAMKAGTIKIIYTYIYIYIFFIKVNSLKNYKELTSLSLSEYLSHEPEHTASSEMPDGDAV